jgi:hypothetical protein
MLRLSMGHRSYDTYEDSPKIGKKVWGGWFHAGANTPTLDELPHVSVAILADALGCPGGEFASHWDRWMDDNDPATRRPPEPFPADIPLKRAVTLRSAPGLDAEVLLELPAGTQISPQDCRLVDDNQAIWYEVTHEGVTGWLSARFASVSTVTDLDQRSVPSYTFSEAH